jgi:co-chaperonin GroES (HSP10)
MALKPLEHCVLVEPIQDDTLTHGTLTLFVPDDLKERHVQHGYVRAVGKLTENIPLNSIVIFLGWKAETVNLGDYANFSNQMLRLHENDIEGILEDWPDA